MKCNYCDYEVSETATYCPNCGERPNTKKKNNIKNTNIDKKEEKEDETDSIKYNPNISFIWGLLGYFIPIVGLVLFIIWKNDKPKDSKAAGIGALIRVVILSISLFIMFISSLIGYFNK